MSQHALLSPSDAARWMNCRGSIAACKGIEKGSSSYADEGGVAHNIAAGLLVGGDPSVGEEMAGYINQYTDAVRLAAEGGTLLVEQSVDISYYTREPNAKGTADAIIFQPSENRLEVHDLKYGMGHIVFADNNPQLMIYALGALDIADMLDFSVKKIRMVIHQPRRDHISVWEIPLQKLLEFGERVMDAGKDALAMYSGQIEPKLTPSEAACLWCPIKATCPALTAQVHSAVFDEFDNTSDTDGWQEWKVKQVKDSPYPSPDMLVLVQEWLSATLAHINDQLRAGSDVPGWKLVAGRAGNRAWTDEESVKTLTKQLKLKTAQVYDHTLKSPTQLLKMIPKKKAGLFEPLIGRSDPKPVAVSAGDPRPPYVAAKADEFPEDCSDLL